MRQEAGRHLHAPADEVLHAPFVEMAARHAGPEAVNLLGAYFACGDLGELRALVETAGLRVAETRTHVGTVKCPSVDAFVAAEVESTPLRERISDEVYGRIRDEAREVLRPFTKRGGRRAYRPSQYPGRRRPCATAITSTRCAVSRKTTEKGNRWRR